MNKVEGGKRNEMKSERDWSGIEQDQRYVVKYIFSINML